MYTLRLPAPHLQPYIEAYWFVDLTLPESQPLQERIFVDGKADIIFTYGDAYQRKYVNYETTEPTQLATSNFDAQRIYPVHIIQSGYIKLVGIRFFAGAVSAFSALPAHELANTTHTIETIFAADDVHTLEGRLYDHFGKTDTQVALLNTFFSQKLLEADYHALAHHVATKIVTTTTTLDMVETAKSLGYTTRTLNRHFKRAYGFTPHFFARLVRFRRSQRGLLTDANLVNVALQAGYYDQSHFNRECLAFTGYTPTAYRAYLQAKQNGLPPNLVHLVQDSNSSTS